MSLSIPSGGLLLAGAVCFAFSAPPLLAMTIGLSVYTDATFSKGVITAYGSTTDISSNLGPCNHSGYGTGLQITNADNGTVVGQDFGETINVNEAINDIFGEYSLIGTATATCLCAGQFGGGGGSTINVQPPVINQGGVVIYPSTGGTVSSIEPGTTGVLVIYGTGLAAGGYDLNPVVAVTNGVVITGLASVADDQINVNYSATSATAGTASVTVTTYVATSSSASVPVGDLTPVITGVSPTSFIVAVASTATITGQHLGTTCPSLAFPFGLEGTYSFELCSDGEDVVDFTPSTVASGDLTMTGNGYGNGFVPASGQSSQTKSTTVTAFQVLGKPTVFVGNDPAVIASNIYQVNAPSPGTGTLSASSSQSGDSFTSSAGPPPTVNLATSTASKNSNDRKLTFSFTPTGGQPGEQTMNVTALQFAYVANNAPSNACTLAYGTNRTYTYSVYAHPGQQAVNSDSGVDGTAVTESFSPSLASCEVITGGGGLDANGQFTDHVSSGCSTAPLTGCNFTTTQTLGVGGFTVRTNTLVWGPNGIAYTSNGPTK